MNGCTPLRPADGKATSWCIAPEAGFPDSRVLWIWVKGWCYPLRLKDLQLHQIVHILKGQHA